MVFKFLLALKSAFGGEESSSSLNTGELALPGEPSTSATL